MSVRALFSAPRGLLAGFVFALALLSPAATHAAGPPTGGFYYVVQYGDTLDSIAGRFGVPVQSIVAANGLGRRYPYVGQSLYMSNGYAPSYGSNPSTAYGYTPSYGSNPSTAYGSNTVYTVQPGDTLSGIAQRFGVPVYALGQANHLYNPNFIFAGMRLLVPRVNYSPSPS